MASRSRRGKFIVLEGLDGAGTTIDGDLKVAQVAAHCLAALEQRLRL